MRTVIQLRLAANNFLLIRKWNHAFLLFGIVLEWKWQIASLSEDIPKKKKKKMRITNKLGDRMIKQFFSPFVNLCYCFLKMKKMFWVVYFLPMIAQEKDWSHPVKLRIRRRSCRRFSAQAGCCQGSSRDHIPQIDNDNHHYFIIIINKKVSTGVV